MANPEGFGVYGIQWKVDILQNDHQCVHMKVGWKNQPAWFLSAVYGSPK